MQIPIEINGKEYVITRFIELNGKNYLTYEDEDTIYVNAYTIEDDKLNLLDITELEKQSVIKEITKDEEL